MIVSRAGRDRVKAPLSHPDYTRLASQRAPDRFVMPRSLRSSRSMRAFLTISLLLAVPLAAQQPRQLTAADYERAERALAPNAVPLVTGLGVRPTWLADGRFWYRTTVPNGSGFFLVDPARRSRE